MKYLKSYEKYPQISKHKNEMYYWLIPTDNRFKSALNKICDNEIFIERKLINHEFYKPKKYIFVAKFGNSWGYNDVEKNNYNYDALYEQMGLRFGGYINFSKKEIDNFEMMKNIEKYNI